MIFLSHNSKDKPIVEQIATKLAAVFGQSNVFYDSWSIQPGDGVIDKMDEGIKNCKIFFFLVSGNSLTSQMVRLEWQAALLKATGGGCKFVPVRVSDCEMPAILKSTLFIDLYTHGLDVCVGQMTNVIQGANTFTPQNTGFSNLAFRIIENNNERIIIDILAQHFLEPISHFLILVGNMGGETTVKLPQEGPFTAGFHTDLKLTNGIICNGHYVAPMGRGITPPMPLRILLELTSGNKLDFKGVLHQKTHERFEPIPLIV